jgi:hypothetical protein
VIVSGQVAEATGRLMTAPPVDPPLTARLARPSTVSAVGASPPAAAAVDSSAPLFAGPRGSLAKSAPSPQSTSASV